MKRQTKNKSAVVVIIEILILAILLMLLFYFVRSGMQANEKHNQQMNNDTAIKEVEPTEMPIPVETPEPVGVADFEPHAVEGTEPENLISETAIMVDGEELEGEYKSKYEINFDLPEKYSSVDGVIGFRGNNFRSSAAYGTAELSSKTLSTAWQKSIGGLSDADGNHWSGSGWTGQPLIVKWPDATRKNMSSMFDWARDKDGLVEVIHACLDGKVYFYELSTGEYTRDPMNIGFNFKGAGALDPRGYPILYLGSGLDSVNGSSRVFVISLIDNTVMFEFGKNEGFSNRTWDMFDSSPLVCAETDQLIYPGENGILYIVHLNSKFNEKTGELSVEPDNIVKWKYDSVRAGYSFWLGFETSASIINHYIFLADNGGLLMCLDLNTLELVWVQDILDDTNSSPVVDIEDGHPYIYISPSFHEGWRASNLANIPVFKIDAETGEIIWQVDYDCYTVADVSGGVQGTIAVGKNKLSDLIFVPIARTPSASSGILAAIDKHTGEKVWEKETAMYSWSSPVDFYDADGNGYIAYCNFGYNMFLLDGLTGEQLDAVDLGGKIEASPSMYENYIVIGTRAERTFCLKVN